MSLLFGEALHRAYPLQEPHYRPSGIANCGRKQAAGVHNIARTNTRYEGIWQMELGRAGQDIGLRAFPHLGFEVVESVKIEGPLPGEGDAHIIAKPNNMLQLDEGDWLGEVKLRNTYAYNHVWLGQDLLAEGNQDAGVQVNTYMGMRGIHRAVILLFPFDSSAVRNDWRFMKGEHPQDEYIRVFTTVFNPELYVTTLQRLAVLEESGLEVAPEFNPVDPKDARFPCGYCDWLNWCVKQGPGGVKLPEVPKYGMPLKELHFA